MFLQGFPWRLPFVLAANCLGGFLYEGSVVPYTPAEPDGSAAIAFVVTIALAVTARREVE